MPAMNPVSGAELASIRADLVAAVCDKACSIYHKSTSAGTSGEPLASYPSTPDVVTVAGMRQPTGGELANFAFVIEDKVAWTVLLPLGTDVRTQSHVVIEGNTLEAHVTLEPHSYPGLLGVICAELK